MQRFNRGDVVKWNTPHCYGVYDEYQPDYRRHKWLCFNNKNGTMDYSNDYYTTEEYYQDGNQPHDVVLFNVGYVMEEELYTLGSFPSPPLRYGGT